MPHGHCYFWMPEILWPTVASEVLIGIAYILFSCCRIWKNNSAAIILTRVFIFCCGISHFFNVLLIWQPYYFLNAAWLVLLALLSIAALVVASFERIEIWGVKID